MSAQVASTQGREVVARRSFGTHGVFLGFRGTADLFRAWEVLGREEALRLADGIREAALSLPETPREYAGGDEVVLTTSHDGRYLAVVDRNAYPGHQPASVPLRIVASPGGDGRYPVGYGDGFNPRYLRRIACTP